MTDIGNTLLFFELRNVDQIDDRMRPVCLTFDILILFWLWVKCLSPWRSDESTSKNDNIQVLSQWQWKYIDHALVLLGRIWPWNNGDGKDNDDLYPKSANFLYAHYNEYTDNEYDDDEEDDEEDEYDNDGLYLQIE